MKVHVVLQPPKTKRNSLKHSNLNASKTEQVHSGCLICKGELIYTPTFLSEEKCVVCGLSKETNVKCVNNHYICDKCHSNEILGIVEQVLIESTMIDPIKLAARVFELPNLNMHGPEYHSIVPGVIVTAYQNKTEKRDVFKINEAIRRGKDTKGGSCGFNGNCGAAVGTGVAVSIIEGATPMSKTGRGNAMLTTGNALIKVSKYEGPRCCKRDSIASIESFMESTHYFEGLQKTNYICKQHKYNKSCMGIKCTYFPLKTSL